MSKRNFIKNAFFHLFAGSALVKNIQAEPESEVDYEAWLRSFKVVRYDSELAQKLNPKVGHGLRGFNTKYSSKSVEEALPDIYKFMNLNGNVIFLVLAKDKDDIFYIEDGKRHLSFQYAVEDDRNFTLW